MKAIDVEAFQTVREIFARDKEQLRYTLEVFIRTAERLLSKLNESHLSQNWSEMIRLAHGLGSNCGSIGAMGMRQYCKKIETSNRNAPCAVRDAAFKNLLIEFELAKTELTDQIEKLD